MTLSRLIWDSKTLQVAAFETDIMTTLSKMVKKPVQELVAAVPKKYWSIHSPSSLVENECSISPLFQLGQNDPDPDILHTTYCRAAAMNALSSMTQTEDLHRKRLASMDILPSVVQALVPYPEDMMVPIESTSQPPNPELVIIAACELIRILTRAILILRTALRDANLVAPLVLLFKHRSPLVRLAVTQSCCNFLLQFSPMRHVSLASSPSPSLRFLFLFFFVFRATH